MISYALAIHIAGAVVSFAVAGAHIRSAFRADTDAIRRHLSVLAACMIFDGATGALLAISSGTPAIAICDNIAYYVAVFVGTTLFSSWYPERTRMVRVPLLQPLAIGSVIPFMPALVATLAGF